ncbi:MAG TPA: O-antigen ligase family protein [Pyrinomonadaceae bacterium]|nr:O-antigen ligase family protein [Pyrinomonadaceae bacterium]
MTNTSESLFPTIISYWPAMLLVGLGSAFLPLAPMLGYRWSVELALAIVVLAATVHGLISRQSFPDHSISFREFVFTALPILLFISWSFLSAIWSMSWRSALHHSLLWSCYLAFFVSIRQAIRGRRTERTMLKALGTVLFAISLACLAEYAMKDAAATKVFNERYYSYAEAIVTLLPVFVACWIEAVPKWSRLALLVAAFSWAAMFATTSRTMLAAGVIGLAIFVFFSRVVGREVRNPERWIATLLSFLFVAIFFLVPFQSQDQPNVLQRMSAKEDSSVKSAEARVLLWGLAVEGFKYQPIRGIGADNYFARYKSLRESLSARDPNDPILEINEDLIPERAHNEYLQILAELGIIGALLFGWLLVGVAYMFWLACTRRASLLTLGALSGMAAFFVASGASSYSFRMPANGICFFFLLAVASRGVFTSEEKIDARLRNVIPILVVAVSLAMIVFCIIRVNGVRHMTNSLNATDEGTRGTEIENAIAIDPSEPMFRFYYGQQLYLRGRDEEAIPQFKFAIDSGLANSTALFALAKMHERAGHTGDALAAFEEALRIFPRSVFLKTAFASFLRERGDYGRADAEYEGALLINEKQARSWQLAHDEGLERLVHISRTDQRYLSPFDLKPEGAPRILSNFQTRAGKTSP